MLYGCTVRLSISICWIHSCGWTIPHFATQLLVMKLQTDIIIRLDIFVSLASVHWNTVCSNPTSILRRTSTDIVSYIVILDISYLSVVLWDSMLCEYYNTLVWNIPPFCLPGITTLFSRHPDFYRTDPYSASVHWKCHEILQDRTKYMISLLPGDTRQKTYPIMLSVQVLQITWPLLLRWINFNPKMDK